MAQIIAHCLESKNRTKDVTLNGNITFESLIPNNNVLLKGLKDSGFKKPSPIQFKAIPVGRCGFDMVVKSKSGTGKTLVYSVIALDSIEIEKPDTQVLILAPTREIAIQIEEVLTNIGIHFKGLKTEFFIGGLPLEEDKEKCKNCHIAVGAPGRIKHLIHKGILKVNSVHLFVLDEADKLMEASFMSDVNEIFNSLPDRKQIIATSATYLKEIYSFLGKYMLSPVYIETETETPLLLGLKQFVKVIKPYTSVVQEIKFKNEELLNLFSSITFTQSLIFTNYQTRAESISNFLNQNGWNSTYISAAQTQSQRIKTMMDLKNFKCKILLSTDLSARGIDAAKVDLVINYDVPIDAATYLHRMGRTGRYGSLGVCIDFISSGATLEQWQNMLGIIGGCSLGIPKLPEFNGTVLDLLKINVSSEHHIFGTISNENSPEVKVCIKKNILDLKNKSKNERNTGKLMTDFQVEKKILDSCQGDMEQLAEMDTSNFLNMLITDNIGCSMKCNDNVFTFEHDRKATNCKNQLSKNILDNSIKGSMEMSEKFIFDKNKALLCVTEIISNNKSINDLKPDLHILQNYLNIIKNSANNDINKIMALTKSRPVTNLLKNIDKLYCTQETNTSSVDENIINRSSMAENTIKNNIENIFDLGFQYATKCNTKHWSTYLPNSELNIFHDLCRVKEMDIENTDEASNIVADSYGIEYESDECDTKNESDELVVTKYYDKNVDNDDSNSQFMKWIPVEKSGDVNNRPENSNWEHLASYFNHCSETLWQNGLCFEKIEDFDNWFYGEWQAQVAGVRNYVQQNIYIQGMNSYKESKYSHSKK